MKIRGVDYGDLFLAPMAGVSDVGFREQAVKFGADTTVTEMLSARAMFHNPRKTSNMIVTAPNEKVVVAQIFGHEPDFIERAIKSELLSKFTSFDLNMGCPAPKIIKNGEGGALMNNLKTAREIIETCRKSTDKPLSVKFRKGFDTENYLDFAKMCEDAGADYITFHARTVKQGYSGVADYDAIAEVKAKTSIKVVGNGDVVCEESYKKMLETGVDAVMVGRGALGQPWIFTKLKGGDIKDIDKYQVVRDHIQRLRDFYEEDWLKLYIRKHLLWYTKGVALSTVLRSTLATCDDIDKCLEILKLAFADERQD